MVKRTIVDYDLHVCRLTMKAVCVLQGEAVSGTVYFQQVFHHLVSLYHKSFFWLGEFLGTFELRFLLVIRAFDGHQFF